MTTPKCGDEALRQLLAGIAMQGLLAGGAKPSDASGSAQEWFLLRIASEAVQHADALLAELARRTP